MTRISETDGCARGIAVGDTVHVRGVVTTAGQTASYVKFDFLPHLLWLPHDSVSAHEPAQLKVGDKVQSKDGRVGTIRYIEDDWAVVKEAHKGKTFRYLIDLQRAPAQEGRAP